MLTDETKRLQFATELSLIFLPYFLSPLHCLQSLGFLANCWIKQGV